MAKTLVQAAKDLNVGTGTVVEFLAKNGHSIDNKPNAKITDAMWSLLSQEFSKSAQEKEKADQIQIGTRPKEAASKPENKPSLGGLKLNLGGINKPAPTAPEPPAPKPEPVVVENKEVPPPVVEEPKPEPAENAGAKSGSGININVVGKIDLNPPKPEPQPKAQAPKAKATPKQEPAPAKEAPKAEKPAPQPEAPKEAPKAVEPATAAPSEPAPPATPEGTQAPDNEYYRAKTPTLQGLKIKGSIDLKKFEEKPAEKKNDNKRSGPGQRGNQNLSEGEKRKRKRKKVTAVAVDSKNQPNNAGGGAPQGQGGGGQGGGQNRGGGGGHHQGGGGHRGQGGGHHNRPPYGGGSGNPQQGNNQDRAVSQQEIEARIRQTMSRVQGGGKKNNRQKFSRDKRDRQREMREAAELAAQSGKLEVTEFISVSELAGLMDVEAVEVITKCMKMGVFVSINQRLDAEVIELIASEYGFEIEFISAEEDLPEEDTYVDDPADVVARSPIVTVMGHVDHGKTSLLDHIRSANVVAGEAGGITQHIGAYEVTLPDGRNITFLDTPGHEAFTAMRARGAKITDVAIIIVAADDNVMPQTKEAMSHAQAAGVPIVFAINKIDKEGADPDRIKSELAQLGFLVEEWGGKYQSQDISAKKGVNIDLLMEKILLEAEILDLKANPKRPATGTVIEASLDKGRGYVAKILVQNGTLNIGDAIVAGEHSGKIKAMFNEFGQKVKSAGPSDPVLVLGLGGAPQAGEKFKEVDSETEARLIAAKRAQIAREQATRASKRISLDEIGRRLALGSFKELNLIVKADVDGSVEALSDSLIKLTVASVQVNVIHKAVGAITESDILLASASDAIIIGFQVRPSAIARKLAEREGVQIKTYSIIYEAINEIKAAMEGMLEPTQEENIIGSVDIREVFKVSKVGSVAGCIVSDGIIKKNSYIRLIRDGIVIFPTKEGAHGSLGSLKRFKDDAKEVKAGLECGLTIDNFNDIKVGDVVEAYEINQVKQKL